MTTPSLPCAQIWRKFNLDMSTHILSKVKGHINLATLALDLSYDTDLAVFIPSTSLDVHLNITQTSGPGLLIISG